MADCRMGTLVHLYNYPYCQQVTGDNVQAIAMADFDGDSQNEVRGEMQMHSRTVCQLSEL